VHHAAIRNLPGAIEAAERYRNDPDTDFHAIAGELTGRPRNDSKDVNVAKVYGAKEEKFAEMIGKPLSEAQAIYAHYDIRLPFVWQLARDVENEAVRLGYTTLYDGARRHWNLWEAAGVKYTKGAGPCPRDEAERRRRDPKHPWFAATLRLAKTFTALNALIQGSAARHTKLWMQACWREGIVPLMQMHDSLECSVTTRKQAELVAQLGEEAVQLEVPMRVNLKFGKSWGDATHAWDARDNGAAAPRTAPSNGSASRSGWGRPLKRETGKMSAAETIAKALGGHRTGNGWIAQCPLHDDRTPSLSISSGKDNKVLVHCHAGCSQRDVFIAVMRQSGLFGKSARLAREDRTSSEEGAKPMPTPMLANAVRSRWHSGARAGRRRQRRCKPISPRAASICRCPIRSASMPA
jgi:hypothetical protein